MKRSLIILSIACFLMGADAPAQTTMGMDSKGNLWQSHRQGNVTQGMDSKGRIWTEIHAGPSNQGLDNRGRSWQSQQLEPQKGRKPH